MATCFFDTSALVKYYHEEFGEKAVAALIGNSENSIFISRLAVIEWHSAFSRLVRTGILTPEEFRILRTRFISDIRNRQFRILPLERAHHQLAIRLIVKYALTQSLRTLDALQLAVAIDLNPKTPLDHFVCSDIPFCQIVQQEGLSVFNPEEPHSPS